jgi:hypothetical protein
LSSPVLGSPILISSHLFYPPMVPQKASGRNLCHRASRTRHCASQVRRGRGHLHHARGSQRLMTSSTWSSSPPMTSSSGRSTICSFPVGSPPALDLTCFGNHLPPVFLCWLQRLLSYPSFPSFVVRLEPRWIWPLIEPRSKVVARARWIWLWIDPRLEVMTDVGATGYGRR